MSATDAGESLDVLRESQERYLERAFNDWAATGEAGRATAFEAFREGFKCAALAGRTQGEPEPEPWGWVYEVRLSDDDEYGWFEGPPHKERRLAEASGAASGHPWRVFPLFRAPVPATPADEKEVVVRGIAIHAALSALSALSTLADTSALSSRYQTLLADAWVEFRALTVNATPAGPEPL